MKRKQIALFVMLLILLQVGIGLWLIQKPVYQPLDMVEVNDIMQTYQKNGIEAVRKSFKESFSFGLYDQTGILLYSNQKNMAKTVEEAIRHQDTLIAIVQDGKEIGKLAVYQMMEEELLSYQQKMVGVLSGIAVLEVLLLAGYWLYLRRTLFLPFTKLQKFAIRVAGGDLEFPLEMDRNHAFGAFTESFDLMREELKKARLQELAANQSKKELVAKLSHDIKTPVASIQAVSELMSVTTTSSKEKQQLTIIQEKANQIDRLITDLFHATLEELQELAVNPKQQESNHLKMLLEQADYQHHAQIEKIPECLLWYDEQRLQQVFDNVVANSYKYANRSILIRFSFEEKYLLIDLQDQGNSIQTEELPRLFEKYYRGKNGDQKSGAGLGLYISRYFIEQMGGYMEAYQNKEGFCMRIALQLV